MTDKPDHSPKEGLLRLGRERLAKRRKARDYLRHMRQTRDKPPATSPEKDEQADLSILLLIEDEQKQELLERLLSEHGFQTLLAQDLRSALSQTSQAMPELLILEATGGAQASLQILQRLRALDKLRELPMLVILPPQEARYEEQFGQAPAVKAIVRPFTRSQIAAAMQSLLAPGESDGE